MKEIFIIILLVLFCFVLGAHLDSEREIQSNAGWFCYGGFFGGLIAILSMSFWF